MGKLVEKLKSAVEEENAVEAGKVADILRFNFGMNYEEVADYFEKHSGIDRGGFEDLMEESEALEGMA